MIQSTLPRYFQLTAILLLFTLIATIFSQPGLSAPDQTQDKQEIILTASAGFGGGQSGTSDNTGFYKENQWIPVHITLESEGLSASTKDIEGWLEVYFSDLSISGATGVGGSAGVAAPNGQAIYRIPVSLAAITNVEGITARKELSLYVFPENYSRQLIIQLVEGNKPGDLNIGANDNRNRKVIASTVLSLDYLNQGDYLYGVIAEMPSAFNSLSLIQGVALSAAGYNASYNRSEIVYLEPNELPENPHGLYALDVLIISGVDTGVFRSVQVQALESWVASGGQLILTGGSNWQNVIRGFKDSDMLPLVPNETLFVNDLSDLNRFLQEVEEFEVTYPISAPEAPLAIANGELKPGAQILVSKHSPRPEEAIPLVTRKAFGEGSVIFIGFDATHPLIRNWPGIANFYQRLLSYNPTPPPWSRGIRSWYSAENAATIIPEIRLPSVLLLCSFLAVYVAVIGPLNYLLLRALKRREWGWLSIPALVIFFTVFVLVAGNLSRGTRLIQNRVVIVRSWPDVPTAEIDGVLGLYSPRRGNFVIEAGPSLLLHPISRMSSNTGGTNNQQILFWQSGERELTSYSIASNIRIDIGGIQPLAITGSLPPPEITSALNIQFNSSSSNPGNAHLVGTITNQSSQQAWENLMLLTPNGVVHLVDDFMPGATLTVSQSLAAVSNEQPPQTTLPIHPTMPGVVISPPLASYGTGVSFEKILGTSNFYDSPELYQRYQLLSSVLDYYSSMPYPNHGIYLIGWSSTPILETNLFSRFKDGIVASTPLNTWLNGKVSQKNLDTAFYLIKLNVPIEQTSEEVLFSPGDFRWQVLESDEYPLSPYGYTAYAPTQFSLEYTLIYPLTIKKIDNLNMNLLGDSTASNKTTPSQSFDPDSGDTINDLSVMLYRWQDDSWIEISELHQGMNNIPNPETFFSNDGRLRVQVSILRTPFELRTLEFFMKGLVQP